jgi:uncharacterized protein
MMGLSPKQKLWALIIGVLVYAALMAALFGWLVFNAEDTTQRRISQIPAVTVALNAKEEAVPDSWTGDAPEDVDPPQLEEPKPEVTDQPETVPPEEKAEEPKTPPTPEPAKTETPSVEEKAVEPVAPTPSAEATPAAESETPVESAQPQIETNIPPAPASNVAWQRFARPFDQKDTRPRIGLIISDLGFASAATQTAVQELPGEVTLAFSSMAPDVEGWIAKARAAGHESLLTVPMEPENYPKNDPGPNTLLISLPNKDNVSRMRWALSRAEGYVGIMPLMGEKFVLSEEKLAPVLDVVKQEGLLVVDSTLRPASLVAPLSRLAKIPFSRSDTLVDAAVARAAIETQLDALEKTAREKGQAIGVALPYPVTFEKLKIWIPTLQEKGIVLAPITALTSESVPPAVAPEAIEATAPAANPEEVQ